MHLSADQLASCLRIEMRSAVQHDVQHSGTLSSVRRSTGHDGRRTEVGVERVAQPSLAHQGRHRTRTKRVRETLRRHKHPPFEYLLMILQ